MTEEKMRMEAMERLEDLTKRYHLNPNLLKYFKEEKLYYSHLTALGLIGSIDTITYHPNYTEVVKRFEKKYKCLVYHAIESHTRYGTMLALLYVGPDEEYWEVQRVFDDCYISSYVVNLDHPKLSEFGDIVIGGFEESGVLVRLDV